MADYDYKEYNSTRINYKKKRKTTIKRSVAKVGNKSYERVEIREGRSSYKGLIGGLLGLSILLLFGSYFFIGGFNSQITKTQVNDNVINEINGVEYTYEVNYVDYDYTYKLNQLQSFRNIFSLESFSVEESELPLLRVPNPIYFYPDGKYSEDSYLVGQMIDKGYVHIQQGNFELENKNYIYYYLYADVVIIPNGYINIYDSYVNSSNLVSWIDYQKRLILDGDMWYDDLVFAFKVIHAPLIWIGNFIYDLGVIVNFLVNW